MCKMMKVTQIKDHFGHLHLNLLIVKEKKDYLNIKYARFVLTKDFS